MTQSGASGRKPPSLAFLGQLLPSMSFNCRDLALEPKMQLGRLGKRREGFYEIICKMASNVDRGGLAGGAARIRSGPEHGRSTIIGRLETVSAKYAARAACR